MSLRCGCGRTVSGGVPTFAGRTTAVLEADTTGGKIERKGLTISRPAIWHRSRGPIVMFTNYFKIAIRRLFKERGFSIINIAGLALGMACSLLIMLWVQDERSVDRWHANSSRLYYLYRRSFDNGVVDGSYSTAGDMAKEFKRQVPEAEMSTGL